MLRPAASEYNPYFQRYIDLTEGSDFLPMLAQNTADTIAYFNALPAHKHDYRYEAGKWTPKEVLMHIMDTERVFNYRALVASRGDSQTPLMKMDPDLYVSGTDVSTRTIDSLLDEFAAVRAATTALFSHMTAEQAARTGNNAPFIITPRALGYIIIGHIRHHINILNERYL